MMEAIRDAVHYLDTTYPSGVDREKYTDLKYNNREQCREFCKEHSIVDRMLLEKVAVKEFLENSPSTILAKCMDYMEE